MSAEGGLEVEVEDVSEKLNVDAKNVPVSFMYLFEFSFSWGCDFL